MLEERDRLQAQLAEVKNQLEAVVQERYNLQAELNTKDKQLQDVCSVKPAEQNGLVRDVSHYLQTMTIETTTESQATQYTPPEGWRLLEVGETLTLGDEIVQSDDGRRYPTERVGSIVVANQRYIRRIEPQPEEQPQPRPQPVQVCEGRWQTRNGMVKDVKPTPPVEFYALQYPWWDGDRLWNRYGLYVDGFAEHPMDLVTYLGPIEQLCEGRWKTRGGAEVSVSAMPTDHDDFSPEYPWWDGDVTTWANDGVFFSDQTTANDLVTYLGPIESEPEQEFKPYTFAAYIVGDKSQPDALRIVWATEEWIQHANFGIVHRMSDLKFSGNDTFTPDQFS
ncbi:MAG: hypothetical protein ACK6EB_23175, partial [Planctomyces sp.]